MAGGFRREVSSSIPTAGLRGALYAGVPAPCCLPRHPSPLEPPIPLASCPSRLRDAAPWRAAPPESRVLARANALVRLTTSSPPRLQPSAPRGSTRLQSAPPRPSRRWAPRSRPSQRRYRPTASPHATRPTSRRSSTPTLAPARQPIGSGEHRPASHRSWSRARTPAGGVRATPLTHAHWALHF